MGRCALLAIVGLLVGCNVPVEAAVLGKGSALTLGEEYRVGADPGFTAEERAELDACADAWRDFSDGALRFTVVDGPGDVALYRSGERGLGYFLRGSREVWIDADGLYAAGFTPRTGVRAMCMNLAGQLVGVPLHDDVGAMSTDHVVPRFTEADRRVCVLGRVCSP